MDCEDQDGYYRDGCLYRREINIPDTYSEGPDRIRNFNSQPWKVPRADQADAQLQGQHGDYG